MSSVIKPEGQVLFGDKFSSDYSSLVSGLNLLQKILTTPNTMSTEAQVRQTAGLKNLMASKLAKGLHTLFTSVRQDSTISPQFLKTIDRTEALLFEIYKSFEMPNINLKGFESLKLDLGQFKSQFLGSKTKIEALLRNESLFNRITTESVSTGDKPCLAAIFDFVFFLHYNFVVNLGAEQRKKDDKGDPFVLEQVLERNSNRALDVQTLAKISQGLNVDLPERKEVSQTATQSLLRTVGLSDVGITDRTLDYSAPSSMLILTPFMASAKLALTTLNGLKWLAETDNKHAKELQNAVKFFGESFSSITGYFSGNISMDKITGEEAFLGKIAGLSLEAANSLGEALRIYPDENALASISSTVAKNPQDFRYNDIPEIPEQTPTTISNMLLRGSLGFAKGMESLTLGLNKTADTAASTQYVICPVGVGQGNIFDGSLAELNTASFGELKPKGQEIFDLSKDSTVDSQMEVMEEIFSDLATILGDNDNLKDLIKAIAVLRAAISKTSRIGKVRVLQQLSKSEALLRKVRRLTGVEARNKLIKSGVDEINSFLTSFDASSLNASGRAQASSRTIPVGEEPIDSSLLRQDSNSTSAANDAKDIQNAKNP